MSRRGEITIECATPKCHADAMFTADDLRYTSLDTLLFTTGWRDDDVCPQCVEEERDALESGLPAPLRVVK